MDLCDNNHMAMKYGFYSDIKISPLPAIEI